jgi:RNA-directed DNA polymerase
VLKKRLAKYGLELHAGKTRMVDFHPSGKDGEGRSFDFLGFTHTWRKSRKGAPYVGRTTSKSRFTRAMGKLKTYLIKTRNQPLDEQRDGLSRRLQGHYNYYGMRGNAKALGRFLHEAHTQWWKSLRRRSGHHAEEWSWERFNRMLAHQPLPKPRIMTNNA